MMLHTTMIIIFSTLYPVDGVDGVIPEAAAPEGSEGAGVLPFLSSSATLVNRQSVISVSTEHYMIIIYFLN